MNKCEAKGPIPLGGSPENFPTFKPFQRSFWRKCYGSPCWWAHLRSHSSFIHVSLKSSRDFQNTLCACLIANARIKQDICISLCCVISLANFLLSSRIYDCLWHMKFCITFKPWLSVRVFLQKCLASSVHDVVAAHKVDQH